MSTYNYKWCPYCKEMLTSKGQRQEGYFYEKYIGLKYERCPNCNKIYSTGKKLYYQMNEEEKNKMKLLCPINMLALFATLITIVIVLTFFIGGIIISIAKANMNDWIDIIWIIIGMIAIPCLILGIKTGKKIFDEQKELTVDDFKVDDEVKKMSK